MDHLKPGDDIRGVWKWLNRLADKAERNTVRVARGGGLAMQETQAGTLIFDRGVPRFWGKVTAVVSGSRYTLVEQYRASGAWTAGTRSVTAQEANSNTSVSTSGSVITPVYLEPESNEWIFQSC